MNACENCDAEFLCGRLEAILQVIKAREDLEALPELKTKVGHAEELLKILGWSYPRSAVKCSLSEQKDQVRHITAELIAALDRGREMWTRCDGACSLTEEEACNE